MMLALKGLGQACCVLRTSDKSDDYLDGEDAETFLPLCPHPHLQDSTSHVFHGSPEVRMGRAIYKIPA